MTQLFSRLNAVAERINMSPDSVLDMLLAPVERSLFTSADISTADVKEVKQTQRAQRKRWSAAARKAQSQRMKAKWRKQKGIGSRGPRKLSDAHKEALQTGLKRYLIQQKLMHA